MRAARSILHSTMSATKKDIVVVGGGIIGCTTAYYLTRHPLYSPETTSITVIEASKAGPATGASGKAGGLVARWAYPKRLVDVSFIEHVKLAEEHGGKDRWGWRYVNCGSWEGRAETQGLPTEHQHQGKSLEKTRGLGGQRQKRRRLPDDLLWIQETLTDSYSTMAPEGDTAQVHPYLFTTSMMDLAKEKGASFILGKVTSVMASAGKTTGISYETPGSNDGQVLPATHVIVCAGAWSPTIVPGLDITTTKAHSITIRPEASHIITPYVLFTELSNRPRAIGQTEIYPRPDNEVYVCGPGEDGPLPDSVDDVVVDHKTCDAIYSYVASISPELKQGTVEKRQACFLPLGGPLIGAAKKIQGLVIATGHTCWVRVSLGSYLR